MLAITIRSHPTFLIQIDLPYGVTFMHIFLLACASLVAFAMLGAFSLSKQKTETLQYLYFIRFSIVLWLFPPLFAVADMDATRTLSRGIFVPEFLPSYIVVGFFLVTTSFVSLVTARATIINGEERFKSHRPGWMTRWFVNDEAKCENRPVLLSLVPSVLTSIYLLLVGSIEGVYVWRIVLGLIVGWAVAFAFWFLVNAWYYLSYRFIEPEDVNEVVTLGANAARTVLFPRWLFGLRKPGVKILSKKTLEDIVTEIRPAWSKQVGSDSCPPSDEQSVKHAVQASPKNAGVNDNAKVTLQNISNTTNLPSAGGANGGFSPTQGERSRDAADPPKPLARKAGYCEESGNLYEAQSFTYWSAAGFVGLYVLLWPLTAPVPTRWCLVSLLADIVVLAAVCWVFYTGRLAATKPPETEVQKRTERKMLRWWKIKLSALSAFFALVLALVYLMSFGDHFPTFASVLLLVLVVLWLLSALAYWLDSYRVPVLTFFLMLAVVPRIVHGYGSTEEHYISTVDAPKDMPPLQTPAQILKQKLESVSKLEGDGNTADRPFVIITATGGGLHATAWTALLLRELNKQLGGDAKSFRDHVLLISTVSGSSLTLSYYLEELDRVRGNQKLTPDFDSIATASKCPSLEAVGWGLAYYDLPRAILPVLPFLSPSSGQNDLTTTPFLKDRTWALRRAIERNKDDEYCRVLSQDEPGRLRSHQQVTPDLLRGRLWPKAVLESNSLTLAKLRDLKVFPAFTMNTTTAEGGDRFLLANYRLPEYTVGPIEGLPAESFLPVLGNAVDLPLSSAAQMSATFPYVSSAARIPEFYTQKHAGGSVHFVDGGYYDDDGTASAIEFLRYALDRPTSLDTDSQKAGASDVSGAEGLLQTMGHGKDGPKKRLNILLIEIRNSKDLDALETTTEAKVFNPLANGEQSHPSNPLDQLSKPLNAFWNAGHGSVTSRDRNGLDLLIQSHHDNLELHQIIFDDQTQSDGKFGIKPAQDPLSWSLTPKERRELEKDSTGERMRACLENAQTQFLSWNQNEKPQFRCEPSKTAQRNTTQPMSKLTP